MTTKRPSPHKGKNITSDYIDYEKALLKGRELLWGKKPAIGFYIILAINTGLRISDLLALTHADLYHLKAGDTLEITEGKTNKKRNIRINTKIADAYRDYKKHLIEDNKFTMNAPLFLSQKGTVYAIASINSILKDEFAGYAKNISSHSLRKSFGRHVYVQSGESEKALILLSDIFRHSSMAITRRYLGLRAAEIGDVYMNL